jgi:hypothetical protein
VDPFGAFRQKLEVWVRVDVENVDQLCLQQSANVHPLFVDLLNSKNRICKMKRFFIIF